MTEPKPKGPGGKPSKKPRKKSGKRRDNSPPNILCLFLLFFLSGCASNPNSVRGEQIDSLKYLNLDCDALFKQMQFNVDASRSTYYELYNHYIKDISPLPGVGLRNVLSRFKGEYESMERLAIIKDCGNNYPQWHK